MKGVETILVVSDLHVGSVYGLMPPTFRSTSGCSVSANPGQVYLWERWNEFLSLVPKRVDAVVFNGDLIDGAQPRQRGTELCFPTLSDQVDACLDVIAPLLSKSKKHIVVAGTEYHDGRAAEELESLAARIGAIENPTGFGRRTFEAVDIDVGGVVINFSHGISVASGLYRATPADREGVWSALAGKDGKALRADVVVRAHAHIFVHVEHASKHIVINPCWQLQTRYMRKNSAYRTLPDIGATLIHIDPERKRAGRDPVRIEKILFPLPRPVAVTVKP